VSELGYTFSGAYGIFPSYGATTIMKIAYGKNTPTAATDPEVIETLRGVALVRKTLRSSPHLVEWIPWLKYIPWYGQELKSGYKSGVRLNTGHLNRVRQEMVPHRTADNHNPIY